MEPGSAALSVLPSVYGSSYRFALKLVLQQYRLAGDPQKIRPSPAHWLWDAAEEAIWGGFTPVRLTVQPGRE